MNEPLAQIEAIADDLSEAVEALQFNASLRRHSTMRVGGPADMFGRIDSASALERVVRLLADADQPLTILGLGSNIVVHDDGVRGLVARLGGDLTGVRLTGDDLGATTPDGNSMVVEIGAGTVNAHAVRDLHAAGLVGAEFLALVPGTIGGAVVMNAGTRWGELSEILESVQVVDLNGARWLVTEELEMSYRHCKLPEGAIVTAARIRVDAGDATDAARKVRDEKSYREATQPYKLATNGSVFANPEGDFAGRLIEACGLKGQQEGAAIVSPKHANWIVNQGDATARDVLHLMATARRKVFERFGLWLTTEVRLVGGSADIQAALAEIDSDVRSTAR